MFDYYLKAFYAGELPQPAIGFVKMRVGTLGKYWRQDGLTLPYRIDLNTLHANRPLGELIVTLAHEMGHLQQHLCGKPGRGNYHNRQFRLTMEQIGIPCDARGHTLAVQEPSPFNMCAEVPTPNLYTVSQRNYRQEPDTSMTVTCRLFSCSSSNIDVERAGP